MCATVFPSRLSLVTHLAALLVAPTTPSVLHAGTDEARHTRVHPFDSLAFVGVLIMWETPASVIATRYSRRTSCSTIYCAANTDTTIAGFHRPPTVLPKDIDLLQTEQIHTNRIQTLLFTEMRVVISL